LIKKLIAEQKDARSRVGFKSVDEIDSKIDSLQKQVDSGTMKLVDEKKALTEISNLRRSKKGFSGLDDLQKKIDEKKAENTELKKSFDNPESRALSQKYEDNQKELDDIKAAREDTNKNYDTLKAERDKLYEEQQVTFKAIRKVKDDYYAQRKAFKEYEDTIYQQRRERRKAEQEAFEKEKRRRIAEQKLEEASEPAFLDQIRTAEGLIRHFDPTFGADEGDKGPGEFAATAQRTIDESGFKGMKVVSKQEEDFFVGGGGKKKGKGKKGTAAPAESGKLNMNIGIIEELAKVGVDPPSTQTDVPAVVEKLKEKLAAWKKDQDSQTKKVSESVLCSSGFHSANPLLRTLKRRRRRLRSSSKRPLKLQARPHRLPMVASTVAKRSRPRTPWSMVLSRPKASKPKRRLELTTQPRSWRRPSWRTSRTKLSPPDIPVFALRCKC
jgi:hypothetical protein